MGDVINATCEFQEPYNVFKIASGAINFKVYSEDRNALVYLLGKVHPNKKLCLITLSDSSSIQMYDRYNKHVRADTPDLLNPGEDEYAHIWLTWYGGVICIGKVGDNKPVITCRNIIPEGEGHIGFIKFVSSFHFHRVKWLFDGVLPPEKPLPRKKAISTGKLKWLPLRNSVLPEDALIGGMEIKPTYIARALHNGSLIPGKYVPWLNLCLVAWGRRAYAKNQFEILCGYDAEWVDTEGDSIPENAVVGGYSDNRGEPLYVGRAHCEGQLIPGKVHILYKKCFVPYMSKEYEYHKYQVLVSKYIQPRAIPTITWRRPFRR